MSDNEKPPIEPPPTRTISSPNPLTQVWRRLFGSGEK